jgi:hypothetical protein
MAGMHEYFGQFATLWAACWSMKEDVIIITRI